MTIAENIVDVASTRVALANKLAAAVAELQRLVERDQTAEQRSIEVDGAVSVVAKRRHEIASALDTALASDAPSIEVGALVEDLNKADADLASAKREHTRSSAELGTARAERAKAAAVVDDLRARLRKLVAG